LGGAKFLPGLDHTGDSGTGIAIDSHGNVIVIGTSTTTDFPLTEGAFTSTKDPNEVQESFVAKIGNAGHSLLFSTLIPGTSPITNGDYPPNLKLDSADNIIVAGSCNPTIFKPTTNPYNFTGGPGFLAKLSSDGAKLLFGIQLPGGVFSTDITPTGIAFLASAYSPTWPSVFDMPGLYHFNINFVYDDYCIGQFSNDGSKLLRSVITRLLPTQEIRSDRAGNLYMIGFNNASPEPSLPTTPDAYQRTPGFLYFVELSPEQDRLLYATLFGGSQLYNGGEPQFAFVGINRFAIVGSNGYGGVPVTSGVYDSTPTDGFAALLSLPIYTHVELTPSPVVGGNSVAGKVTLPAGAPVGGAVITLSSSDTGVKVPATVTIPSGAISQTFAATTTGVAANATATISAKYGVGSGTASLVRTKASLLSLAATPTALVAGQTASATLKLDGSAGPGGDLIQLTSSNANLTVPASLAISVGSNQGVFQVKTVAGTGNYTAVVTAKLGTVTKTLQITVDPALSSLTVSAASVVAGAVAQGVVKISGKAGASGVAVSLSSSNVAAAVPSLVTVPSGATVVAFSITTAGVNVAAAATISAKQGSLTQTAVITVQPAVLSFYTLTPTSVKGGTGVQGIVRLNGPAGPSGVSVTLSSPSSLAVVPAKVVVAPGASYFVFAIGTKQVTVATQVSLKAGAITSVLTINP
jgi:hypothetical protein